MHGARVAYYEERLQEQYDFDGWIEGMEDVQRANIKNNIEFYTAKIADLRRE